MSIFSPCLFRSFLCCFLFPCYGHHRDLHSFLHDALPISATSISRNMPGKSEEKRIFISPLARKMAEDKDFDIERIKGTGDRKSTRLNSSHVAISYAVFCLKKKKNKTHKKTGDITD